MSIETLLTPEEIATAISRPVRYVQALLRSGEMDGVYIGKRKWRVTQEAYERWLEDGTARVRKAFVPTIPGAIVIECPANVADEYSRMFPPPRYEVRVRK